MLVVDKDELLFGDVFFSDGIRENENTAKNMI